MPADIATTAPTTASSTYDSPAPAVRPSAARATKPSPAAVPPAPPHVALVLEDEDIAREAGRWCRDAGYQATLVRGGLRLFEAMRKQSFALVVLDAELTGMGARDVATRLRLRDDPVIPLLLAAPRGHEPMRLADYGADDFIVKPLRHQELVMRLGLLLGRAAPGTPGGCLAVPPFDIDTRLQVVRVAGEPVTLMQREYQLAVMLFQHVNRVLSRERLLDALWGTRVDAQSRTLDTHVSRLRRKLALNGEHGLELQSVYGMGYRLQAVAARGA